MSTPRSHIAAAMTELLAEREHLAARLAKVDALIAGVRDVFHLPAPPRTNGKHTAVAKTPKPASNGNSRQGRISDDLVRVALQNGPLSPGALGERLSVERVRLRRHLEEMETRGLVRITGNTTTKLISLPGVPAKEAP